MKSNELLLKLKHQADRFKPMIKQDIRENLDPLDRMMSRYNLDNYNEIINHTTEGLDEKIDTEKLDDFTVRIDNYFDTYAPNQEEFKEFIRIISIYLTFIAKKPLHPPGIRFSDGSGVCLDGDSYYCSAKKVFIKDKLSLCKYCVAKTI